MAVLGAGEQVVDEGGAGVADMEVAGGAGGDADFDQDSGGVADYPLRGKAGEV